MDGIDAEAPRGVARVLIGVAAALGGAAVVVLLGAGTARAQTTPDAGSGLLGDAIGTVSATIQSVDSAVASLRTPAAPTPAPPAPAPASATPAPASATPVSAAPRGLVQSIIAPVAAAADSTVGAVPVVGSVVQALAGGTPIAGVTEPVASLADTTLGTGSVVVGSVAGTISPAPAGSIPTPGEAAAGSAVPIAFLARSGLAVRVAAALIAGPVASADVISASAGVLARTLAGGPAVDLELGIPTPVSSGSGSGAGSAALLSGILTLAMLYLLLSRRASRLAAPGAPVFDTDSSPD
ncbi:MAG: hypothetical protein HY996_12475 [Micrococcales bacterium]|nr:hypothetical protein [Micrococcales bacterium]